MRINKRDVALALRDELLQKSDNGLVELGEFLNAFDKYDISLSCFKKYVKVEDVQVERREKVSLEDLVDELNSLHGYFEGCSDLEYAVIDGEAYEIHHDPYVRVL